MISDLSSLKTSRLSISIIRTYHSSFCNFNFIDLIEKQSLLSDLEFGLSRRDSGNLRKPKIQEAINGLYNY